MIAWIVAALLVLTFGVIVFRGAPYVPTHRNDIERLFSEVWHPEPHDVLVDIGSGGGGVVRAVARCGARGVGYELNPVLVVLSKLRSWSYGDRVQIRWADFWLKRLPDTATAVYTFGSDRDIEKMAERVQSEATRLGRTILFISYAFELKNRIPLQDDPVFFLYKIEPLQRHET